MVSSQPERRPARALAGDDVSEARRSKPLRADYHHARNAKKQLGATILLCALNSQQLPFPSLRNPCHNQTCERFKKTIRLLWYNLRDLHAFCHRDALAVVPVPIANQFAHIGGVARRERVGI